jgi:farnesyl-diphosphate farnesyltransferase
MPSTQELLVKTSRTFALAIPLLPEPTQSTTRLAYLLFRIADTLEDAEAWPRARRMEGLAQFAGLLRSPSDEAARRISAAWLETAPTRHAAYLELLQALPQVLAEVAAVEAGARRIILHHALRTTEGMERILAQSDEQGRVRITNLEELRGYCYVVAGIVGELLSELFLNDAPSLESVKGVLKATERGFGEGLQLVNILKDEQVDAGDGRTYLPAGVPREAVMKLAWSDLRQARQYIEALKVGGAPAGFYAFTALSEQLAEATMERLEREGAGAKVPRAEVFEILARVQAASSS